MRGQLAFPLTPILVAGWFGFQRSASVVAGGSQNFADLPYSFIGGGYANYVGGGTTSTTGRYVPV